MTQVTIHEAKTHLSRLIQRALEGEEIVIARGRQPLVKMVVLHEPTSQRRLGGARGIISKLPPFRPALEDFRDYMP